MFSRNNVDQFATRVLSGLLVTLAVAVIGFSLVVKPVARSLSWRIDLLLCYVAPLGILGLGTLGHALKDRSQGFAFVAGQTTNYAITLACALRIIEKGGLLNWIFVMQAARA